MEVNALIFFSILNIQLLITFFILLFFMITNKEICSKSIRLFEIWTIINRQNVSVCHLDLKNVQLCYFLYHHHSFLISFSEWSKNGTDVIRISTERLSGKRITWRCDLRHCQSSMSTDVFSSAQDLVCVNYSAKNSFCIKWTQNVDFVT